MIYEPAEDSFLLAKNIAKYVKGKTFLDIGTGSGIQAKTALENGAKSITATDINPESIALLKNKYKINIIQSDLFSNVRGKFDLIAFNPPYLPEDEREDKDSKLITTGGKRGDEIIKKFINQSKSHLSPNGKILILLSSLTPQDKIIKKLKEKKLKYKIIDKKNLFMEVLSVWEISSDNKL